MWQQAYAFARAWLDDQRWPRYGDYWCPTCDRPARVPCDPAVIDPSETLRRELYGTSGRRRWHSGLHRARHNLALADRDKLRGQMIDIEMTEWERLKCSDS